MARLADDVKGKWKNALDESTAPWIVCGIDGTSPALSDRLNGFAGLVDWRLHGQVSILLARGALPLDEICLVPLPSGAQSFLLYQYCEAPDAKSLSQSLTRLGVKELGLAESTFPKDFLSKVKQHLNREGIRFSALEPA